MVSFCCSLLPTYLPPLLLASNSLPPLQVPPWTAIYQGCLCPAVGPPRPVISWGNLPQPGLLGSCSPLGMMLVQCGSSSNSASKATCLLCFSSLPTTPLLTKSEQQCHVLPWLAEVLVHNRLFSWKCPWLGFTWQGSGSSGAAGLASVQRDKGLPHAV